MNLDDFAFELPDELIAQFPLSQRSSSRLLCLNSLTGGILHKHFFDLPEALQPNDLLVFNNTRVIPARIFGFKTTGGKVEILIERILSPVLILAQIGTNKSVKIGMKVFLTDEIFLEVTEKVDGFFVLQSNCNITEITAKFGQVPLPPYISRNPAHSDLERYQTVYAKVDGAVAAPTAGLHFDEALIELLKQLKVNMAYITLHVGAGTFQPVREQEIINHQMHCEYLEVSEEVCEKIDATKRLGGRVIAVGTTSVRALETAAAGGKLKPFVGDTKIFIYPGFKFNCVDALITNFHLPKSTLLMLVSAFAGLENIKKAYREAIKMQYRFYSYGDAMFIEGMRS